MNYRDVITHKIDQNNTLLTACDSCGGIGQKQGDVLNVDPYIVGFITARVAILEVLTLGGRVVGVTVPIANEPEPTGMRILEGVKACLKKFEITAPTLMSMEKNMISTMTAAGVVVNGLTDTLRMASFESGDQIVVVGRPSVGAEVIEFENEIFDSIALKTLLTNDSVKEILPVGSKGINTELQMMMQEKKITYDLIEDIPLDLEKSCGPSTSAIVIIKSKEILKMNIPVYKIGNIL